MQLLRNAYEVVLKIAALVLLIVGIWYREKRRNRMANTVESALGYNKGALAAECSQLSGATVSSSPRNDFVWAYRPLANLRDYHRGFHDIVLFRTTSLAFGRAVVLRHTRGLIEWSHASPQCCFRRFERICVRSARSSSDYQLCVVHYRPIT
jgi:hypothetical protein